MSLKSTFNMMKRSEISYKIQYMPYNAFTRLKSEISTSPYSLLWVYLMFALVLFLSPRCEAQKNDLREIDSLRHIIRTTKEDIVKVKCLIALSSSIRGTRPDSSLILIKEADQLATKINYKQGKIAALYALGSHAVSFQADYNTGFGHYLRGLKMAEESNDTLYMAHLLSSMGYILCTQGQNEKAIEHYYRSNEMYSSLGMDRSVALNYSNMAEVYIRLDMIAEADSIVEEGLAISERLNDDYILARSCMLMSDHLAYKGQYPEAVSFAKRAMDLFYKMKDYRDYAYSQTLIAGQYLSMGKLYEAGFYADSALSVCEIHNLPVEIMNVYELQENIAYKSKDYEKAYYYKGKFTELYNQSFTQSKSAEIANMESNYLQDKKDARTGKYGKAETD